MTVAGRRTVGVGLAACLLVAAVAVLTASAVGAPGATAASAAGVKPYSGFEKQYRSAFPIRDVRASDSEQATRAERGFGVPASERVGGSGGAKPPA